MSAGFGFSIGDFIAVLKLVSQVVDSLRESSHATSTFRSLITELHSLETALIRIKRLDPDTGQNVDKIALWAAASQCQRTIDDFYGKVKKYQPHLQGGGTGEKIKDVWMKFRWTVCKKDDLDNFRAEIRGHASSIEILLLTVAMDATSTNAKKQDEQNKSLGSRIQDFSMQVFGKLNTITDSIAHNVAQGKALLESSAQIVQTNLRVFQMVHDIQLYILKIPGQVQRQQPVYLIDPLNKECPFHLEFIRSADALLSVLKVNLKESECGPGMIERGEFALEEMGTESTIDLGKSWDNCFYPGQRVAMSMIFPYQTIDSPSCPRCRAEHRGSYDKEVTCTICGIVFRRITEVLEEQQASEATALSMNNGDDMKAPTAPIHGPARPSQKRKREEDDVFTNLRKFRRIRLVPPRPLNEPFVAEMSNHAREGHRCKLYELRQNDWFDLGTGFITTMPHSEVRTVYAKGLLMT
ncbi:hypothetical protein EJ08DRAFT_585341 [Tothia fuscella]|uniref:Fungal N-terminal domain-containing protein n=1 Tax=Tothia fuscella TaxID=1048955 RepID=A0A9P4NUN8_9PEZI|nr:hypothetical protein EJ08DRAFT_585341 [Tothia fuscella]